MSLQIFITTYDKPWFEYATGFLEGKMAITGILQRDNIRESYEIHEIFDNPGYTQSRISLQMLITKRLRSIPDPHLKKIIRKILRKKTKDHF